MANEGNTASGACTKCGCKAWRPGDGDDNEAKCVNTSGNPRQFCDHKKSDHR